MEYGEVIVDGEVNAIIDSSSSEYLTDWIKSAIDNGGYYIGRYETGVDMSNGRMVVQAGYISYLVSYNDIGWYFGKYAYNDYSYIDVANSFAWDTAIRFIYEFEDTTYPNTVLINAMDNVDSDSGYSVTGTTNDVRCNIYDMAGINSEWTNEYDKTKYSRNILRGGYNFGNGLRAAGRIAGTTGDNLYGAVRQILWIQEE